MSRRSLICSVLVFVSALSLLSYTIGKKCAAPCVSFPNGADNYYGIVREGEEISYDFLIKNEGGRSLLIRNIKTGCACTVAKAERLRLAAGESSKIRVSYKGRPVNKPDILQIWVETNDPRRPISTLLLRCDVHLRVFWRPRVVSIYASQGEQDVKREVIFSVDKTEKFDLGDIRITSDRMAGHWEANDDAVKCVITLNPDCPRGNWADKVTAELLFTGEKRDVVIPVNLMIH